jgi:hypothetical protein
VADPTSDEVLERARAILAEEVSALHVEDARKRLATACDVDADYLLVALADVLSTDTGPVCQTSSEPDAAAQDRHTGQRGKPRQVGWLVHGQLRKEPCGYPACAAKPGRPVFVVDQEEMPCCGRTPFEVLAHRITLDPKLVTCGVDPEPGTDG